MEKPVPDLQYYTNVAKLEGISKEALQEELINLCDEVKLFIGVIQIQMNKLKNETTINYFKGD